MLVPRVTQAVWHFAKLNLFEISEFVSPKKEEDNEI